MANEFHPFPRLPFELREMIWKQAILQDRPAAHIFRAYNSKPDTKGKQRYLLGPPESHQAPLSRGHRPATPACTSKSRMTA